MQDDQEATREDLQLVEKPESGAVDQEGEVESDLRRDA